MSTTQNQTLQNQLLEIEKEEADFKEKHPHFVRLESVLSKKENILWVASYISTALVIFLIYFPQDENFGIWDFLLVLALSFYPGIIAVVFFSILLENYIERLIYYLYRPKVSKEQFDELRKLKSTLSNNKWEILKQIRRNREQAFGFDLEDLRYQLTTKNISFENADTIKQRLELESRDIIIGGGYQIYTSKWYAYLFDCINELLKNNYNTQGTTHQPKAVEKTDTSTKETKNASIKNIGQKSKPTILSAITDKLKQTQQKLKPATTNKKKPEQQVRNTVQPLNNHQKTDRTVESTLLSKQTIDSNDKTAHTQKSVVAPTNNTEIKTRVVKSPEPTILSGIVEKIKKTQQRIKSVRAPSISPKMSVPTTRPIPSEKKSASTGEVKTTTEPTTEVSNKTTTTSFSGNTDNVTPVRTKPTVVPEEKTLVELFGEQHESEPESQKEPRQSRASVKTDYLKLNEHRHVIGERGEEFVLELEKSKLATSGFKTLSEQVVHVSKRDDSKGYDILSFFEDGKEKYLEVKTTTEDYNAPFYLTESELVAMKKSNNYFIYRVYNFDINTGKGKYFIMDCKRDLDKYYLFQPVSFRVSPKF